MAASVVTFSPANATTYYWGAINNIGLATATLLRKVIIPKAGIIRVATLFSHIATSFGTTEQSSMWIRLNNTTDYLISSTLDFSANIAITTEGLNIPVVAGDFLEIKWTTPTWATPPVAVRFNSNIFVD